MNNLFQLFLRLSIEIWEVDTSFSTVIAPSFPEENYSYGASFLLGANECRQSGELS